MSEPKFKVGETVILRSKARPDLNGEYLIADFSPSPATLWKYEIFKQPVFNPVNGNYTKTVAEKLLRKKYPPSTQSFHTLLSELTGRVDA